MNTVLITGFDAYGRHAENASESMVELLRSQPRYRATVVGAILPTSYREAELRMVELLNENRPGAVLMLGQTVYTDVLRIELVARNRDSDTAVDKTGQTGRAHIVFGGPKEYETTLPIRILTQALSEKRISHKLSRDAGSYLCNHIFYFTREILTRAGLEGLPAGFIHLPVMIPGADGPGSSRELVDGLTTIVDLLSEQYAR